MNAINYDTLFQRVKKGVSYRQIAKEEDVSVRCVTRMMRWHRESGSIYPRTKSVHLHDETRKNPPLRFSKRLL